MEYLKLLSPFGECMVTCLQSSGIFKNTKSFRWISGEGSENYKCFLWICCEGDMRELLSKSFWWICGELFTAFTCFCEQIQFVHNTFAASGEYVANSSCEWCYSPYIHRKFTGYSQEKRWSVRVFIIRMIDFIIICTCMMIMMTWLKVCISKLSNNEKWLYADALNICHILFR